VAHAELDFGNGRRQLSDPQEAYQLAASDPTAFATHSIAVYCADVDDVTRKAEQAGATVREPRANLREPETGSRRSSIRSVSVGP
jgi:PhnB protein